MTIIAEPVFNHVFEVCVVLGARLHISYPLFGQIFIFCEQLRQFEVSILSYFHSFIDPWIERRLRLSIDELLDRGIGFSKILCKVPLEPLQI